MLADNKILNTTSTTARDLKANVYQSLKILNQNVNEKSHSSLTLQITFCSHR
jgi:hypothetical protein